MLNLCIEKCECMDAANLEYCVGPVREDCDYEIEHVANPKRPAFPVKLRYKSRGEWLISYFF